jgi:hypothetical protein
MAEPSCTVCLLESESFAFGFQNYLKVKKNFGREGESNDVSSSKRCMRYRSSCDALFAVSLSNYCAFMSDQKKSEKCSERMTDVVRALILGRI